jgi:hypothetical protein
MAAMRVAMRSLALPRAASAVVDVLQKIIDGAG